MELTAYLCRRFGLDPLADGVVLDHAEGNRRGIASGHGDVEHWFPKFGRTMDDFRRDTAALLAQSGNEDGNEEKEDPELTREEITQLIDQRVRAILTGEGTQASPWGPGGAGPGGGTGDHRRRPTRGLCHPGGGRRHGSQSKQIEKAPVHAARKLYRFSSV